LLILADGLHERFGLKPQALDLLEWSAEIFCFVIASNRTHRLLHQGLTRRYLFL